MYQSPISLLLVNHSSENVLLSVCQCLGGGGGVVRFPTLPHIILLMFLWLIDYSFSTDYLSSFDAGLLFPTSTCQLTVCVTVSVTVIYFCYRNIKNPFSCVVALITVYLLVPLSLATYNNEL